MNSADPAVALAVAGVGVLLIGGLIALLLRGQGALLMVVGAVMIVAAAVGGPR